MKKQESKKVQGKKEKSLRLWDSTAKEDSMMA